MPVIFHLDMNAFFASCEQIQNPQWQNKPLIVAHDTARGIVTTASYEARKYGIHSAMPTYIAKQKCPFVIVVPPHFDLYQRLSAAFFDICRRFTPLVQPASIDECYMDVSSLITDVEGIMTLAENLRDTIYGELKLPLSIGIAPNKFLAKMASDMKKPMGITVLTRRNIPEKMWPLAIGKMFGIGEKTAAKLEEAGILTIGDLAHSENDANIRRILGKNAFIYWQHARGYDFSAVDAQQKVLKSVGNSHTFPRDEKDPQVLDDAIRKLSAACASRAKKQDLLSRQLSLTIRYSPTETVSRSCLMEEYTNDAETLQSYAMMLFERHHDGRPVRLLGVAMKNVRPRKTLVKQLSLFTYQDEQTGDHK